MQDDVNPGALLRQGAVKDVVRDERRPNQPRNSQRNSAAGI
jgi:hypothetical protein